MTQSSAQDRADRPGVDPYFDVRAATTPAWVGNDRLAFLQDASGVPQVWTVGHDDGGAPRPLTDLPDRVGALLAVPGGARLVFGMDRGGDERQQIWTVAPDGGEPRALTADPATIHAFGAVSPDGRRFAFASNARDQRFFDVLVLEIDGGDPVPLLAADELLTPLAFSPDGASLLVRRQNTNLDADLFLVPLDGGERVLLTPHDGEAAFAGAAFDPTGGAVYALSNQDSDFVALVRIDLADRSHAVLAAPDWDVEALAVAPDGAHFAYAINEDGASRLILHDIASGAERPVTGLPPGVIEGPTWSPDGQRLAFGWSGPRHPSDVWVCDVDGAARQATFSDLAGLDQAGLGEPDITRYPTFDGREIPALWFRPAGDGPWPVVVDVHGGPESQRRLAWAPITQFLLARGYAVLAPNVRGSTGYGKTYCHLDDVDRRMDAVADLAAASDWLRARPDVATARIAVMGQSYGGFMTLAALTTYPERWAAGVDVVGIANWQTFFEQTGPWRRTTRAAEYGDPERDADLLRDLSPLHRADRIAVPLLVIHGRNDPRVPLGEAEQIVAALRSRGREAELLVFDDEGHGLVKRPNRIAGYGTVARFLDRILGGEPS
ncbi:MAG: S9 family peptidase [Chloroflexota bacterium]|nr:S9 family peptidase [Chloroflexota bacterium]